MQWVLLPVALLCASGLPPNLEGYARVSAAAADLSSLQRFPSFANATANRNFAWAHLEWATEERDHNSLDPFHPRCLGLNAHVVEAQCCYDAWSDLAVVLDHEYPFDSRVAYLEKVQLRLGAANFRAGRMPPPAPVWRFQRID